MTKTEGDNSFGSSSVILGILSVVMAFAITYLSVILGLISIVFAIMQNKRGKNSWSKAGLILGIIGIILGITIMIFLVYLAYHPEIIPQIDTR